VNLYEEVGIRPFINARAPYTRFGGAIMPEMMRWLWRDGPVSTDPHDDTERGFRPAARSKNDRRPKAK